MNDHHPLDRLFAEAARYAPHGEASDFGFTTRLRAALAGVPAEPAFADLLARFSWRFSAACLPVIAGLFLFLTMQHYSALPEGVGGLVSHWMDLFPLGI
jgi:hypothetical protein